MKKEKMKIPKAERKLLKKKFDSNSDCGFNKL
jgi:hypothetical protein